MENKIKWIRVMAFKHDGSIHKIWDKATLIEEDNEKIIISNSKTLIRESNGRTWMGKEPTVATFYKNRWFNILGFLKKDGVKYYSNIASPCVIDGNVIKYIDYDLDLVKTCNGEIIIVDKKEFKHNTEKYQYSPLLVEILEKELELLKQHAKNGELAFNDELVRNNHQIFLKKLLGEKNEA